MWWFVVNVKTGCFVYYYYVYKIYKNVDRRFRFNCWNLRCNIFVLVVEHLRCYIFCMLLFLHLRCCIFVVVVKHLRCYIFVVKHLRCCIFVVVVEHLRCHIFVVVEHLRSHIFVVVKHLKCYIFVVEYLRCYIYSKTNARSQHCNFIIVINIVILNKVMCFHTTTCSSLIYLLSCPCISVLHIN